MMSSGLVYRMVGYGQNGFEPRQKISANRGPRKWDLSLLFWGLALEASPKKETGKRALLGDLANCGCAWLAYFQDGISPSLPSFPFQPHRNGSSEGKALSEARSAGIPVLVRVEGEVAAVEALETDFSKSIGEGYGVVNAFIFFLWRAKEKPVLLRKMQRLHLLSLAGPGKTLLCEGKHLATKEMPAICH